MTAPMLIGRDNTLYDASFLPAPELRRSPVREVLRVLRRNVWLIGTVTLLVIAAGAAVTFSLTKTYTATAIVVLKQSPADPLASPDAQAPRPDEFATETAVVVFKSRDLAEAVVKKIGYEAEPQPQAWWVAALCGRVDLLPHAAQDLLATQTKLCAPPGTPPLSDRVDAFIGQLGVEAIGRSRAVSLTFTSRDPDTAARALNELVAAEQAAEQDVQSAQVGQTANWLEARSAELRDRWLKAEQRVSQFRVQHGLTQTSTGGGAQPLILQQLGDATTALSQAQSALSAAAARASSLQQAARSDKRGLVRMSEQPVIAAAATALNELYLQRAKLTQQYGPDYPAVASMSRQIAQAESSLNAQLDSALQVVRSDVTEKQAQVDSLSRSLEDLRRRFDSSNAGETEVQSLEGEAKGAQLSYQAFLTQAERFAGRTDIQQPVTAMVARAHTPDAPSFPRKSRFLLASAVFGLVAGAGLAFTREHLRHGFTEISRIGAALALPLVATVPLVKVRRRGSMARHVVRRPLSAAAEAARSMVASITLVRNGASVPQTVAVTSVTAQEGKSIIALWLASVVARSGHDVLVIDCDHRAGTVAKNLQGREGPGLADVLDGKAVLGDVIQRDAETGIHFIPADHSAALLGGCLDIDRLRAVLEEFKRVYKLVVLDTPPLLATSNALLYSSAADQTLLVCRWRTTPREAVLASLNRLREAHARITGVVMSMVPPQQQVLYSDTLLRRDQVMLKRYYGE